MTTAEASPGDFATKGDLDLVRRDLQHAEERLRADMKHMEGRFDARVELTEERLRSEMHLLEVRLIRWIVGTLLAAVGVGATFATAIMLVFS